MSHTADRPTPRAIFFFPNGTAAVFDQLGRQMPRYQMGLHRHAIARLAEDGIDWRTIPEIQGAAIMADPPWWDADREARCIAEGQPEEPTPVAERPTIVCLCGSTRFPKAFETAMREETLAGKIVLSVGLFGHREAMDMGGPVKAMLDQLHLRKIDLADEVLLLNVGGYLGDSSRRELAHAREQGKVVRFLEGPTPNREETP